MLSSLGMTTANSGDTCGAAEISLQLRVLGFGLLQDGDVGIGVFPQGQKILVGGACFGGVLLVRVHNAESIRLTAHRSANSSG